MFSVYELTEIEDPAEYIKQLSWSNLWYEDLEEAGVERVYFAFEGEGDGEGDEIIGFQTVSRDGLCVAIEVKDEFMGKGVARSLVEKSNCWKPERNECPGFWEKMENIYA